MTAMGTKSEGPALRVTRARDRRILGGVCAGLSGVRGIGTGSWRAMFLLAALCGGVGIIAYLACWLVIPETEETPETETVRSVVLLAWASGGLVGVVLVAGLSAAATVFGLGWIVVGLAGVLLVFALSPLGKRVPPIAALITVAALSLPAVAVALSPLRLSLQDGASVSQPATAAAAQDTVYRSGFGTQLIDLRRTALPSTGTVTIHVDAGLRRTIVALPSDTCVRVTIDYAIHPFASQLATLVDGRSESPFHGIVLFGDLYGVQSDDMSGTVNSAGSLNGPTLKIDFTSQGGSLYVRDYPDTVSPDTTPNWPGFRVTVEPRPNLAGEPKKVAKMMVAAWHRRRRQEIANKQLIDRLMPGPCVS